MHEKSLENVSFWQLTSSIHTWMHYNITALRSEKKRFVVNIDWFVFHNKYRQLTSSINLFLNLVAR